MGLTNRPLTQEAAKKLMALDVQNKEILTYAEKSALFNEVQKALKALNLRAKQYGVDEVYTWCKFVLGAKPMLIGMVPMMLSKR